MRSKTNRLLSLCLVLATASGACQGSDPRYTTDDRALARSIGNELLEDNVDDAAVSVLGDVLPAEEINWWLPTEDEYAEAGKGVVDVSVPADSEAALRLRLRIEAVGTRSDAHATTPEVMSDDPVYVSSLAVWLYHEPAAAEEAFVAPSKTFPNGLTPSAVERRCVARRAEVVDQYSTGVYARGVTDDLMVEVGVVSSRDEPEASQIEAAEAYVCELLDRVLAVDGVE